MHGFWYQDVPLLGAIAFSFFVEVLLRLNHKDLSDRHSVRFGRKEL